MRLGWHILAAASVAGHAAARPESESGEGSGGTDLAAWAFAPPSLLARKVDRLVRASARAMRDGAHEEVARKLGIAMKLDPTRADASYGRALALSFLERNDEARALLRHAQDLDPFMDPWIVGALAELQVVAKGRSLMTHILNTRRVQDAGSTECEPQAVSFAPPSLSHAHAAAQAARTAQLPIGLTARNEAVKREPSAFFSTSRSMPTANAEVPCRSEGT